MQPSNSIFGGQITTETHAYKHQERCQTILYSIIYDILKLETAKVHQQQNGWDSKLERDVIIFWTRKWDRTVSGKYHEEASEILVLLCSPDLGVMVTKLPNFVVTLLSCPFLLVTFHNKNQLSWHFITAWYFLNFSPLPTTDCLEIYLHLPSTYLNCRLWAVAPKKIKKLKFFKRSSSSNFIILLPLGYGNSSTLWDFTLSTPLAFWIMV